MDLGLVVACLTAVFAVAAFAFFVYTAVMVRRDNAQLSETRAATRLQSMTVLCDRDRHVVPDGQRRCVLCGERLSEDLSLQ